MKDFHFLKGKFITFEGLDGSGKSTQAMMLNNYLKERGVDVVLTREIGGTIAAEQIRSIVINSTLEPMTELLLIMSARIEHINKVISPAIKSGKTVICDRFVDSSAVYQGSLGIDKDLIYRLHDKLAGNIYPDVTFFIDLDISRALSRVEARGNKDKFESKDKSFHQKLQKSFIDLVSKFSQRIKHIKVDNCSIEKVHKKIIAQLLIL